MSVATVYPELEDAQALKGRNVSITVSPGIPSGTSTSKRGVFIATARQNLLNLVPGGTSTADDYGGQAVDIQVRGRLGRTYESVSQIRYMADGFVSAAGDASGVQVQGLDVDAVGVVDLETPIEKKFVDPSAWYTDPTGESNPDGTVNWSAVVEHGAEKGLDNFGETVGKGLKKAGELLGKAAGAAGSGFTKGLGLWWTILLVLVLLAVLGFYAWRAGLLDAAGSVAA